MFIKAVTKESKQKVYLNTDFIVDIFDVDKIRATVYTHDPEREAYLVEKEEVEKILQNQLN